MAADKPHYNDDPDLVKLEKSIVLIEIITEKMMVGSTRTSGLSQIYAGIIYTAYWWRMRMQDIVRVNGVTKSTVTHYVDQLEKKGLVRRVRDDRDRRDVYIELTKKGRAWVEANDAALVRYLEERQADFTPEEWQTLIRLLSRFVGDLEKHSYDELLQQAIALKPK